MYNCVYVFAIGTKVTKVTKISGLRPYYHDPSPHLDEDFSPTKIAGLTPLG